MAIPAIPPEERADERFTLAGATVTVGVELDMEVGVRVGVGVGVGLAPVEKGSGVLSNGQASPGSSIKVEFSAYCFCTMIVWLLLGLMTPTMP